MSEYEYMPTPADGIDVDRLAERVATVMRNERRPAKPIPADSGDYTFTPRTAVRGSTAIDDTYGPLTYDALVATVWRLQNELHGLAAQVVEMREQLERERGEL